MKFKADEIATVIKEEIRRYTSVIDVAEVGKVLEVGDGVARIYGLPNAMSMEMLQFASGAVGVVFNLEENSIGTVVLGDYLDVKEGEEVRTTGQLLSVPVGEALIMTAMGLAVAVPAVLAYNLLIRRNKTALEQVRAFGADLHMVLLSGGTAKRD